MSSGTIYLVVTLSFFIGVISSLLGYESGFDSGFDKLAKTWFIFSSMFLLLRLTDSQSPVQLDIFFIAPYPVGMLLGYLASKVA